MLDRYVIVIVLSLGLIAVAGCDKASVAPADESPGPADQPAATPADRPAVVVVGPAVATGEPYVTINRRRWDVELAVTFDERYLGMSGRRNVPSGTGMLFIFQDSAPRVFCMRDCYVPLDIAFINEDRLVVAIHTMAVEPDRRGRVPYRSGSSAMYALEVAAGALGQANVNVGDKVALSPAIEQR